MGQYSHSPGGSQIMSRSTFIQGMAGDPLSLPVEYQDLVMKINSDHEEEVVKITEDTETKGGGGSYLSSITTVLFYPLTFLVYLADTWVEERVKKIIKKTSHLRAKYYR